MAFCSSVSVVPTEPGSDGVGGGSGGAGLVGSVVSGSVGSFGRDGWVVGLLPGRRVCVGGWLRCGPSGSAGATTIARLWSRPERSMPWFASSGLPFSTAIQLPRAYACAIRITMSAYDWEWL